MSRQRLVSRISAHVTECLDDRPTAESFEALALDVHKYQCDSDTVTRRLVSGVVDRWDQIPAVPVALFRQLAVGTVAPDQPHVAFHTSGTTAAASGIHRMVDTAVYDLGSVGWANKCVPNLPSECAALLADSSNSSLSHMVRSFGPTTWHLEDGALNIASLRARIRSTAAPLFVATTAFALASWLESETVETLPAMSVLMVTGGFKGRKRTLTDSALYGEARERLGPARLITEYGMTELSSQLWGTPGAPYRPPPWLRVLAVDPISGSPLPPDTVGQLRFYDLCNLDSTLAIETMDAGFVHNNGSITLLGRLTGAPPRGCSLTVAGT